VIHHHILQSIVNDESGLKLRLVVNDVTEALVGSQTLMLS
jgi:hypothetical protein